MRILTAKVGTSALLAFTVGCTPRATVDREFLPAKVSESEAYNLLSAGRLGSHEGLKYYVRTSHNVCAVVVMDESEFRDVCKRVDVPVENSSEAVTIDLPVMSPAGEAWIRFGLSEQGLVAVRQYANNYVFTAVYVDSTKNGYFFLAFL